MERAHDKVQHGRAARTVAGHAVDAQDCSRLLSMLGLDTVDGMPADTN